MDYSSALLLFLIALQLLHVFIHLGFYVAFNTVQVISRWVVGRAEATSTYSRSGFCTVDCRPMASNPGPQRWEARVLPLCHRGPAHACRLETNFGLVDIQINKNYILYQNMLRYK